MGNLTENWIWFKKRKQISVHISEQGEKYNDGEFLHHY